MSGAVAPMTGVDPHRKSRDMIPSSDIREILKGIEALAPVIDALHEDDDLFERGLSSFDSVQLMLALEDRFDIEFPDHLLNRRSFSTIRLIRDTVASIKTARAA